MDSCKAGIQRLAGWDESPYHTRHMMYDAGKVLFGVGAGVLTGLAVNIHRSMGYFQQQGLQMMQHACSPFDDAHPEIRLCNALDATQNMTSYGGDSASDYQLQGFLLGAALAAIPTGYFLLHRCIGPAFNPAKGYTIEADASDKLFVVLDSDSGH